LIAEDKAKRRAPFMKRHAMSFLIAFLSLSPSTLFADEIQLLVDVATVSAENRCFDSPQDAVPKIARMLRNENWNDLASYYDLTRSHIERSALISGGFFIRPTKPESAHPGGFWRYRHPFAPEFDFGWVERVDEDGDTVKVFVTIEIDQGGGMIQRGIDSFLMRESECGFQVLPDD